MALAIFSLQDSLGKVQFFEQTFLLVNTNIKVVLNIVFRAISNTNFQFDIKKFTWRSYIVAKALSTTSPVKLIDKKEFPKAALDENSETFIVHVSALEATTIHPSWAAQIASL